MLYKVTMEDGKGNTSTCYMDDKTLKSMTTDKIVDVENVKWEPPNNKDFWNYEDKIF